MPDIWTEYHALTYTVTKTCLLYESFTFSVVPIDIAALPTWFETNTFYYEGKTPDKPVQSFCFRFLLVSLPLSVSLSCHCGLQLATGCLADFVD